MTSVYQLQHLVKFHLKYLECLEVTFDLVTSPHGASYTFVTQIGKVGTREANQSAANGKGVDRLFLANSFTHYFCLYCWPIITCDLSFVGL